MAKKANKPNRRKKTFKPQTKKRTKSAVNGLNLDELVDNVTWDDLAETHKETLDSIQPQIALVEELRKKCPDDTEQEITDAFAGLILSLRDLIIETVKNGVSHAEVTTTKEGDDITLEFATEFKSGTIANDDDALDYINIGAKYYNIQEKMMALMATGWVDLFACMKASKIEELRKVGESADE